jgi:hypothetical protein
MNTIEGRMLSRWRGNEEAQGRREAKGPNPVVCSLSDNVEYLRSSAFIGG